VDESHWGSPILRAQGEEAGDSGDFAEEGIIPRQKRKRNTKNKNKSSY